MSGTDDGYLSWSQPVLGDTVYFGGRTLTTFNESGAGPLSWTPQGPGVIVIPMHDGTGKIQLAYRGEKAPRIPGAEAFTLSFYGDSEDDYLWVETLKATGRAVDYCPGVPAVEVFSAQAGASYSLSRPLAAGIVPGVDETTNPTRFVLDGVLDPAAGSVSGQVLAAAESGELAVWYYPVYRVIVQAPTRTVDEPNNLVVSVTLLEVVSGDFNNPTGFGGGGGGGGGPTS